MEQKRAPATESAARGSTELVCAHAVPGSQERHASRSAPEWRLETRALAKVAACKGFVTAPCGAPPLPRTPLLFAVIAETARGQPANVCASGGGLALRAILSAMVGSKSLANLTASVSRKTARAHVSATAPKGFSQEGLASHANPSIPDAGARENASTVRLREMNASARSTGPVRSVRRRVLASWSLGSLVCALVTGNANTETRNRARPACVTRTTTGRTAAHFVVFRIVREQRFSPTPSAPPTASVSA